MRKYNLFIWDCGLSRKKKYAPFRYFYTSGQRKEGSTTDKIMPGTPAPEPDRLVGQRKPKGVKQYGGQTETTSTGSHRKPSAGNERKDQRQHDREQCTGIGAQFGPIIGSRHRNGHETCNKIGRECHDKEIDSQGGHACTPQIHPRTTAKVQLDLAQAYPVRAQYFFRRQC